MNRYAMAAIACALGLASCGAGQNTKQITGQIGVALRGGSPDVPPNYRELVVQYLKESLIDPGSLKDVAISAPAERRVGVLNGFRRPAVCVAYDARDAFGTYTGRTATVYWFDDGRVAGARRRIAFCEDATYTPYVPSGARATRQAALPRPAAAAPARRAPVGAVSPRPGPARSGAAQPARLDAAPARARPVPARSDAPRASPDRASQAQPAPREFVDERKRGSWFRQM